MRSSVIIFITLVSLVTLASSVSVKTFVESPQGISGFSGMITRSNSNIVITANPKNLREFNPSVKQFVSNFVYQNYSFADDVTLVPGYGFAAASFLDGAIPTLLFNGSVIQSNTVVNETAPGTGLFDAKFSSQLIGADPITYRNSDGKIYAASSFNPFQIFKLDPAGSIPIAIDLDQPVGNNAFQFGPDDALYSPSLNFGDPTNSQIVKIVIDNSLNVGAVTPILSGISYPVALKVSSTGMIYFLARTSGVLYKYNPVTTLLTALATFNPPLDNLCFNNDETKLYISNNDNGLFQYNLITRATSVLYSSPITFPWDIKYDSETASIYVADTTGLKQFKASNGKLMQKIVFDSDHNSELVGVGNANGLTVEKGPDAKIVITDGTQGNIIVLHKCNLSRYAVLNSFVDNTGLAFRQPYSTVRVVSDDSNSEYYLATDTIGNRILKIESSGGVITNSVFVDGLLGPIKLMLHDDYLYIVEGGDLGNFSNDTGRISRIDLNDNTTQIEVLVSGLNNPNGLDIHENDMYIVESGNKRVLRAKSHVTSTPSVVYSGLDLAHPIVISQFNPYPVYPFIGVTVDSKGKNLWVGEYGTSVGILQIKL